MGAAWKYAMIMEEDVQDAIRYVVSAQGTNGGLPGRVAVERRSFTVAVQYKLSA